MEIFFIFLLIEFFIYLVYKKSSLILSKSDLFPNIPKNLINKFNSFDNELGWVNQKDTVKKEISQNKEIIYTYNKIGARSIGELDFQTSSLSSYGDSYCLSREVQDKETWQYFLSKDLNTNITNFGVGNYGLDQSLLRLKREFKSNPTKTVIIAITPYTITRITSVWKHFSEFNNTLAVKPRFVVNGNNLELIPNIIKSKKDLENIYKYKDFLFKYDEHLNYFKEHIYNFPFIFSFIKKPYPLLRTVYAKFVIIFKKFKMQQLAQFFAYKFFLPEIKYRSKLSKKYEKLQKLIINEYIEFSKKNNFRPVILILPTIEDVKYYEKTEDKYYNKLVNNNNDIITFDFMDFLVIDKERINNYNR